MDDRIITDMEVNEDEAEILVPVDIEPSALEEMLGEIFDRDEGIQEIDYLLMEILDGLSLNTIPLEDLPEDQIVGDIREEEIPKSSPRTGIEGRRSNDAYSKFDPTVEGVQINPEKLQELKDSITSEGKEKGWTVEQIETKIYEKTMELSGNLADIKADILHYKGLIDSISEHANPVHLRSVTAFQLLRFEIDAACRRYVKAGGDVGEDCFLKECGSTGQIGMSMIDVLRTNALEGAITKRVLGINIGHQEIYGGIKTGVSALGKIASPFMALGDKVGAVPGTFLHDLFERMEKNEVTDDKSDDVEKEQADIVSFDETDLDEPMDAEYEMLHGLDEAASNVLEKTEDTEEKEPDDTEKDEAEKLESAEEQDLTDTDIEESQDTDTTELMDIVSETEQDDQRVEQTDEGITDQTDFDMGKESIPEEGVISAEDEIQDETEDVDSEEDQVEDLSSEDSIDLPEIEEEEEPITDTAGEEEPPPTDFSEPEEISDIEDDSDAEEMKRDAVTIDSENPEEDVDDDSDENEDQSLQNLEMDQDTEDEDEISSLEKDAEDMENKASDDISIDTDSQNESLTENTDLAVESLPSEDGERFEFTPDSDEIIMDIVDDTVKAIENGVDESEVLSDATSDITEFYESQMAEDETATDDTVNRIADAVHEMASVFEEPDLAAEEMLNGIPDESMTDAILQQIDVVDAEMTTDATGLFGSLEYDDSGHLFDTADYQAPENRVDTDNFDIDGTVTELERYMDQAADSLDMQELFTEDLIPDSPVDVDTGTDIGIDSGLSSGISGEEGISADTGVGIEEGAEIIFGLF